jgi:hypothetical protein
MIGILHHCLETRTHYEENTAFPTQTPPPRPQPLDNLGAWDVFIASVSGVGDSGHGTSSIPVYHRSGASTQPLIFVFEPHGLASLVQRRP